MADSARKAWFAGRAVERRTRQEIRGGQRFIYAPRVPWERHADELSAVWKPGDHLSIFARTDWGKTHLVLRGLAPLWPDSYPWLCVDCKGDDAILSGFGHVVRKLPPRAARERLYDGQRFRIVVPHQVDAVTEAAARVREALSTARRETGWVVHLNEARALTDPKAPGLGLGPRVQALWRMGRPHVTIIAETQAPRWVPADMYDQPSHVYIGGNLDERSRRRLGEIGGDTDNIWRAVSLLQEHEFLYVRSVDGKMQIVKAPA